MHSIRWPLAVMSFTMSLQRAQVPRLIGPSISGTNNSLLSSAASGDAIRSSRGSKLMPR